MVIDINSTNILFMPVTYYTIKGENEAIERITINGEELNLKSDEDLVKAIDSLCAAKKSAIFSDDETSMLDIFGAGFGNQMTELSKHFNEITEDLIYTIENMRIALRNANGCADCTFNDAEIEAAKASDAVEAVANTRTFHWAQKYMDEVIDPASELSGPEYNTLLAMFTQYGEWILNQ